MSTLDYCNTVFFFFFKQKTAYEMRISDWSSDVCSSDLLEAQRERAFDASAEYYFGRGGLISLAGYYKKATNFLYYSREGDQPLDIYGFPGETGFVEQQRNAGAGTRSEERRVGQESVRPCRSRWSTEHYKKKKENNTE